LSSGFRRRLASAVAWLWRDELAPKSTKEKFRQSFSEGGKVGEGGLYLPQPIQLNPG
jgi:hypothetical protein